MTGRKLKAISLFSGVGGLDFGFEAAEFETRVSLDLDPVACATIRLNRDWPVIEGSIADVSSEAILETAGLSVDEADVLIGGPPCQPFSKSGYWARGDASRLNDPRSDTLGQYLRVLEDTRPKAFLIENVPGLAYRGKAEGIEAIRSGIAAINQKQGTSYSFEFAVLNAAHFGVPQMRERLFIVGARDGTQFKFPAPTHGDMGSGLEPFRTAWDAFADLPQMADASSLRLQGKWADLLPSIPEGNNYLWHTERGEGEPLFGWRRRYWNFLLKLAKDKPAWTIQAQPGPATGPFHWENRRLSTHELCRLQTFPDFLKFDCSRADIQRLIGNAVPSALAQTLANEIAAQFFGRKRRSQPLSLIPAVHLPRPVPEKPTAVPRKFLHLAGSDSEHPGTGLGRSALGRGTAAA